MKISSSTATRFNIAALVTMLVLLVHSALKSRAFPVTDSAAFEFIGNGLLHGQRLYLDMWDNKLPTIYLINAFWNGIFHSRYAYHAVCEVLINGISSILLAILAYRYDVKLWALPAFIFAFVVSTTFDAYNLTEFYAVPLILAALILRKNGNPISAGAVLALASTLWIPSLFLAIFLTVVTEGGARLKLAGGFIGCCLAYAAAFLAILGTGPIALLIHEWVTYLTISHSRHGAASVGSQVWWGINVSDTLPLMIALAAVVRRPQTEHERFALGWLGTSLLGACLSLRFYPHYFIPAVAALAFTVTVFLESYDFALRRTPQYAARALCMLLALVIFERHGLNPKREFATSDGLAANALKIAATVSGRIHPDVSLVVMGVYAPEMYLALHAQPPDRYALVGYSEGLEQYSDPPRTHPDLVLVRMPLTPLEGPPQYPPANEYAAIASPISKWRIFERRALR